MGISGPKSLRARLLVTIATALSPVLMVAGWRAYMDSQQTIEARQQEILIASEEAVGWVEGQIKSAETVLEVFEDEIEAGACKETYERLKPKVPYINNVVRFGETGIAACSAVGAAGFEISDRFWHAQMRDGAETVRTDAFRGVAATGWLIATLRRTEDETGEFSGSVAFGLDLSQLVASIPISEERLEVALLDKDGSIFGSSRFVKDAPAQLREALPTDGEPALTVVEGDDGASFDRVIRPLGGGLYALVTRPSPGFVSETTLRPVTTVGLPIATFLVTLIAVWFAVEHLLLKWFFPLRRMTAAYAVGKYDYETDASFEKAPQEIARLSATLQNMARRIGQRDEQLREAIQIRDSAVREIHHRVKNNLQIVSSFVRLQMRPLRDRRAKQALANVRNRIDALSIVHQTLYQHERLEYVQLRPFFNGLLEHLVDALGIDELGASLDWEIADVARVSDDAIPMALFTLEAITNAVKYAIETLRGERIEVRLTLEGEVLTLSVSDDGGTEVVEGLEGEESGLGSKLMAAFAKQLSGELHSGTGESGYVVELKIPHEEK